MDTMEFAKTCFDRTQENAPPDIPRWDDLHKTEHDQIANLVDEVLDEIIRRSWHIWQINFEKPPLRGISYTRVFAATAADARGVFVRQNPGATVRAIQRTQPPVE